MNETESYKLARRFLGKDVLVKIDRPLGSKHPKRNYFYMANYGFIPGITAPDGEELDAYYLGVDKPLEEGNGKVIAIVHRFDDDDDKLVVVAQDKQSLTDEEIEKSVNFQEQWFKHIIVRS